MPLLFFPTPCKLQFATQCAVTIRDWQIGAYPTLPPDSMALEFKLQFVVQLLWRGSALPPSDEGGGPKGRRERNTLLFLGCSLPQSASLTAPSSEGAFIGAVLTCKINSNLANRAQTRNPVYTPVTLCSPVHTGGLTIYLLKSPNWHLHFSDS